MPHKSYSITLELPEEIVAAANRGWRLFTIESRGKKPLIQKWREHATCDPKRIRAWGRRFSRCNWAVATGRTSGVVVIDIDGADGRAALESLAQEGLTLPATLTVTTGRPDGGRHLYFQVPADAEIRNDQNGKLGPHIDVRGEGGYVVLPPSVHATGTPYSYCDPNQDLSALPKWVISRLIRAKPVLLPAVLTPRSVITSTGRRTKRLVSLIGKLNYQGLDEDAILEAALRENATYCTPPLPESKVVYLVSDLLERYPNPQSRRGKYFAFDSRIWAAVVRLGIGPACAYLVIARGTGLSNRSSKWSTKSVMKHAGMGWMTAKSAIDKLMSEGMIQYSDACTTDYPRYILTSFGDLAASRICEASDAESQVFDDDRTLWLPNYLVSGTPDGGVSPLHQLRGAGCIFAIKACVAFYLGQNLRDDGGIIPRILCQKFEQIEIGKHGRYRILGFRPGHLDFFGKRLKESKDEISCVTANEDPNPLETIRLLQDMNLLSFVPHLLDNDTEASSLLHPLGCEGTTTIPVELEIAGVADRAGRALADPQALRRAEQDGFIFFCPVPLTLPRAHVVGIARLTYFPNTKRTQVWWKNLHESAPRWAEIYKKLIEAGRQKTSSAETICA